MVEEWLSPFVLTSLSPPFCSAVFYTIYAISMRLAFKGATATRTPPRPPFAPTPHHPFPTPTHFFLSASLSPQKAPKLSSLPEPGQGGRDVGGLEERDIWRPSVVINDEKPRPWHPLNRCHITWKRKKKDGSARWTMGRERLSSAAANGQAER